MNKLKIDRNSIPDKKTFIKLAVSSVVGAVLYALAIRCFIQAPGSNMLAGGVSGIALIVSKLIAMVGGDESLWYSIFYFALNVPLVYIAFRKIGKFYAIFTLVNVGVSSLLISIIPQDFFGFMNLDPENDMILIALVAGALGGVSAGIPLAAGLSSGGVDIISTYIGIKSGKKIGIYNFIINGFILIAGGILLNEWAAMLYTIVYIFTDSQVINVFYIRNNKMMVEIITNKKDEIADMLMSSTKHGVTVFECEGAYTNSHRYSLKTTILEEEVKETIEKIQKIDPSSFTTIIPVKTVRGHFNLPQFK